MSEHSNQIAQKDARDSDIDEGCAAMLTVLELTSVCQLSHWRTVQVKARSISAVPQAAYMIGNAGATWKVTVYAFVTGIPARPLLRQLLQASLQIEVVSEDCSVFRRGSTVASSNDLISHIAGCLLHFDLQSQNCLRL